jgi:flavin-binding protein dodecin
VSDHIYKQLELTGSSTSSIEEAVNNALVKASKTVHNLRWFEIVEIRGEIGDKAVSHWYTTMKIGFTLDE